MGKGRILLIDEDPRFRGFLKDILEFEGYELLLHSDSDSLHGSHHLNAPQVILINYCPYGYRSSRLYDQLPESFGRTTPPVVVLSAYPEAYMPISKLQYNIFISKPFDLWQFMTCLDELIQLQP